MLAISVTTQGDKVIIDNLQGLGADMPQIAQAGLRRIVRGVHRNAMDFLNGPGRTRMKMVQRNRTLKDLNRRNLRGQSDSLGARPGSYPVPVIIGNLKRLLDFLDPGQSKDGFAAGPLEALDYDSAAYASVIAHGTFSSMAYGPRDFLKDGFTQFNGETGVTQAMEAEYTAALQKRGLA